MNRFTKFIASLVLVSIVFSGCKDDDNIIGLNEAARYGNIKVTLEGTRPGDGEDYTATKNFRFTSSAGPTYTSIVDSDGDYHSFNVTRFFGPIDQSVDGEENYAELVLRADESEAEPAFSDSYLRIETTIITNDERFFQVNHTFNFSSEDVTSYSYNPENGKLVLKFVRIDDGIKATVSISVTVFEELRDL